MKIKKEELKPLVEPFIYDKLCEFEYELLTIKAKDLLTWNRFIIAFNLFYLDMIEKNELLARKVYTEMIRAVSFGSFIEPGREAEKNNITIQKISNEKIFNITNVKSHQGVLAIAKKKEDISEKDLTSFLKNKVKNDSDTIVLGTAHPYKFLETIKKATGKEIKPPKQFLNISDKDEKYDILENKVSEIKNYILEKVA